MANLQPHEGKRQQLAVDLVVRIISLNWSKKLWDTICLFEIESGLTSLTRWAKNTTKKKRRSSEKRKIRVWEEARWTRRINGGKKADEWARARYSARESLCARTLNARSSDSSYKYVHWLTKVFAFKCSYNLLYKIFWNFIGILTKHDYLPRLCRSN